MTKRKPLSECPNCGWCWANTAIEGKIQIYLPKSNISNWGKTSKWKIICDNQNCKHKMWYYPRTGLITRRNKP